MNNIHIVLYDNPTLSDMDFIMDTDFSSFPSSATSSSSSTASDAESAPPDLDQLFHQICDEYSRCVHEAGRVLPPEWTMPDLVRTVIGDESFVIPGFLKDQYYDVLLHGEKSWLCNDLFHFIDLIS